MHFDDKEKHCGFFSINSKNETENVLILVKIYFLWKTKKFKFKRLKCEKLTVL